jgi:hypothetical protein
MKEVTISLNADELSALEFVGKNGPSKLGAIAAHLSPGLCIPSAKQKASRVLSILTRGGALHRTTGASIWRNGGKHHAWEVPK